MQKLSRAGNRSWQERKIAKSSTQIKGGMKTKVYPSKLVLITLSFMSLLLYLLLLPIHFIFLQIWHYTLNGGVATLMTDGVTKCGTFAT